MSDEENDGSMANNHQMAGVTGKKKEVRSNKAIAVIADQLSIIFCANLKIDDEKDSLPSSSDFEEIQLI